MKVILIVVGLVVILGLLWLLFKRRFRRAGQPLTALVFLLKQPHLLTESQVRQAISRAWGLELGSEMQPDGDWLVEGGVVNPAMSQPGTKNYLASANGRMSLINSVSRPYMDEPEQFAETISDMRLRRAVGSHRAWNSVDLFGEPPAEGDKPEIYAALGKLLAEFTHEDCVAIYCPELERCNEYAPAVIAALQSGQPLALFDEPTFAPVVQLSGNDPRMVAAVEESRRRWPEFLAAFQAKQAADQVFAVKARFVDGEDEEFMWVSVQKIEDTSITGRLENSPATLKSVKEGDTVTVRLEDLNDWIYGSHGQPVGGFTMKAMEEAMKK